MNGSAGFIAGFEATSSSGITFVPPTFPSQGAGGIAFYTGATSTGGPISGSFISNANNELVLFSADNTFLEGSLGSASVLDSGSNAAAGNVHWGRWLGTGATINGSPFGDSTNNSNLHYAIGDMPTMPMSGTANYTSVGGTRTTNAAGMTGSVGTG